ncbi:hypothetical protein [Marinifilum flexuosum]|uniref:Uncharacterized protein n=1 Tax=Marinifilum flexuosum TaxID=1117708 RepID=A0A419XB12_9BACT|nr:hypothetical protein [Marinifilum flexuosum]RKE04941.1 hypothetical protein BXY64_1972 [Marinifilum flexuosum]
MKKKTIRIIIGGALASITLTSLLYGFVFTSYLAEELAIPWTSFRNKILMIDWTCLFIFSMAAALLIGFRITNFNATKGIIVGGIIGLLLLLLGFFTGVKFSGSGYYLLCYLIWGWMLGIIIHKKKQLIIKQL